MFVKVTKRDIEKGRIGSATHCPIARAVKRRIGLPLGSYAVEVGVSCMIGETDFTLPQRAHRFIDKFDDGLPVKPFRFRLRKVVK